MLVDRRTWKVVAKPSTDEVEAAIVAYDVVHDPAFYQHANGRPGIHPNPGRCPGRGAGAAHEQHVARGTSHVAREHIARGRWHVARVTSSHTPRY